MLRAVDNADAEARLRAALEHEARCQPEEESDSDDEEDAAGDMDADDVMDDEDEDGCPGDEARAAAGGGAEARAERLAAFGRVMRERFLAGGEAEVHVDYAAVDADATLDERWARVADADAEDAYFDAQAP
jgi:hypothetical protein